ncbi:uncharacterized protein [Montipora capricornis]|uniref:uncharacterized protein isoform X2 n=1 Tax=Montipora capricornis TaxID=246305 RepID=UPI0035F1B3FD
MAAITRRRVGRPKLPGSLKSIRLRESVFNLWRDRKEALGLSQRTDSEFAEFLLHRGRSNTIHESAEVNLSLSCEEDNDTNPVPLFSTPIRANLAGESHLSCVDVTGISDLGKQREPDPGHSRSKLFDQTNNSFTGNPFSAGGFAIDDSLSEEDSDVSVEPTCIFDDHPFPDLEQTVNIIVEDLNRSDTSSDELSDDHSDYDEWHLDSYGSPEHPDVTQLFGENMDISSEEDERTLTMVDPSYAAEDDSSCVPTAAVAPCVVSEAPQPYYIHADDDTNHICGAAGSPTVTEALEQEVSMPQPEETTKPAEKHQAEILKKLEDAFQQLTSKGDLETFLALHSRMRVMVSINKLVELSEDKCALCEKFPQLVELFHSLDIWHKAKKLSKCLHQAARIRGCETLKEWIDDIVNHFWFCCQSCDGSVDELKETWFGVLHHVCGEHEWAGGACKHSPDETGTSGKTYLAKSSKALTALREVVLDKKWLNNLEFYVRFRHTSVLESYNSMLTKYAPKRMAFEYPYFIMRIMLAAIDHNMHLSRGKQVGIGVWVSKNMGFYETVLFFSGNTHSFNTRN